MDEETTLNMDMNIEKGILTIKVVMNEVHGTTKNGKAARIASTRGTRTYKDKTVGTFRVGLNVTKPL